MTTLKISHTLTASQLFSMLDFYKVTLHSYNSGSKPSIKVTYTNKQDFQQFKTMLSL